MGAEPLVEYFVPRSVSEFDLSVASGDTPIGGTFLPLTVRIPRKMLPKQKEKVVTFEDEMAARLAKNNSDLQDVFMERGLLPGGGGKATPDLGGEYITKLSDLAAKTSELSELSAAISEFNHAKKDMKQFKNFKICEDLKKCEDGCSCNAEADCDICKVLDFTMKKDKL
ncbi:unnamed protein product [Phyllotreta striolata]|uniref:Uncharacterized protein n=1 Tax=Phyllotreta striolata TaxID=444603 RepID=A0A9N9TP96_PHYSR|nr:unnamed protein product [Phyllotreta striolata]